MKPGPLSPSAEDRLASAERPAGHLRIRIEGQHPEDVSFLFEGGRRRMPGAAGVSVLAHIGALALILFGLHYHATAPASRVEAVVLHPIPAIVWLPVPGPGGGGGGGGDGMKAPPRRVEMPGRDRTTLPVAKPRPVVLAAQAAPKNEPAAPVIPQLDIDALASASGVQAVVGTLDGVPGGPSRGPGSGGGAGKGNGDGAGDGVGNGLDDGSGRNFGGGLAQPGNGVEDPQPVYTPKPAYTPEAMQAKIQGTATIECVVMPDGTVSRPRVVGSLDSRFGLDLEALKAASKWRFIPARRRGQPVAMLVAIQVTFSLR